ncbi:hypothetical protein QUA41_12370 [Microcoleus sp. Pol11C1]|uniref:hypothetical protein n=1 Tax=unclassified Microcoleus TaxID=2642155 RepID=UPI002FD187C5
MLIRQSKSFSDVLVIGDCTRSISVEAIAPFKAIAGKPDAFSLARAPSIKSPKASR